VVQGREPARRGARERPGLARLHDGRQPPGAAPHHDRPAGGHPLSGGSAGPLQPLEPERFLRYRASRWAAFHFWLSASGRRSANIVQISELDWQRLDTSDWMGPEATKAAAERIRAVLPGAANFDVLLGCDLCWNSLTSTRLAMALSTFALAAQAPSNRSGHKGPRVVLAVWNRTAMVTAHLLRELLGRGVEVRVLHPTGWTPWHGSQLHGLLQTTELPTAAAEAQAVCPLEANASGELRVGGKPYSMDWEEEADRMADIFGSDDEEKQARRDPGFMVWEVVAIKERPSREV